MGALAVQDIQQETVAPPDCQKCKLRDVALCGVFYSQARDVFDNINRSYERVPARKLVRRLGTISTASFFVLNGWAVIYRTLGTGRRQIFDFRIPGDPIALRFVERSRLTWSVQALTDVGLCVFDEDQFVKQAMQRPAVGYDLFRTTMDYIGALENRIAEIGFFSATSRLAYFFINLRSRLKGRNLIESDSFDFPLTQSHIADALGLTTAHVNRTLAQFRVQGILELSRGRLNILDLERLTEIAELDEL